jgi:hypothetical protein
VCELREIIKDKICACLRYVLAPGSATTPMISRFGEWEFTCDREATRAAYERAEAGGADTCSCVWCRNFVLVRDRVYPSQLVEFLESVGIDPRKDGEVYHNGEMRPGEHYYAGWFHVVGSLEKTGDFGMVEMGPGFKAYLCRKSAPELASLKGLGLVQVEFQAEGVPWVLAEASPA